MSGSLIIEIVINLSWSLVVILKRGNPYSWGF